MDRKGPHPSSSERGPLSGLSSAVFSLLAMGFYNFTDSMLYTTLAPEILKGSSNYILVGLIYALPQFFGVLFALVWGHISDKKRTRLGVLKPLVLAGTILFLGYPFATPLFIIILRTIQMIFFSGMILLNALLTEQFPLKKGTAVGTLSMVGAIGSTAGAWASGFILTYIEDFFILFCIVPDVIVFFLLTISSEETPIPKRPLEQTEHGSTPTENDAALDKKHPQHLPERHNPAPEPSEPSPPAQESIASGASGNGKTKSSMDEKGLKPGLSSYLPFVKNRSLWWLALSAFFLGLADWVVFSLFSVYIDHLINLSLGGEWVERLRGLIVGSAGVCGIVISYLTGRWIDLRGRKNTLLFTIAAYFVIWVLLGVFNNLIVAVIIWITPLWWVFNICATTITSDITSPYERGRGIALVTTLNGIGGVMGALLGGALRSFLDFGIVFVIAGFLTLPSLLAASMVKAGRTGDRQDS